MKGDRELRKLMFSISTMEELGEVLSSRSNFRENIRMALYSLMGTLPVARGTLFLFQPRRNLMVLEASRGLHIEAGIEIQISGTIAQTLWRLRRPVTVAAPPAGMASFIRRNASLFGALHAVLLVPLRFKDVLVGLITIGDKYSGEEYNSSDLELVMIMANYIAIGIHNQELLRNLETTNTALRRKVAENRRLYRNLEVIYTDTVRALGAAIDAKDPYTRGHSDRVARIAVAIARTLGLPETEISALKIASHLHDIGKIAIDNSILLKPGRLDEIEMTQIHRHPSVSYDILSNITFPYPNVALIARHHHEWVNGEGYPDRLGPEALLPGMKIISLADAFDAMTSDRPYRPALDLEDAVARIIQGVAVQFDVHVARAFFNLLRAEVSGTASSREVVAHLSREYATDRVLGRIDEVMQDLQAPLASGHGRA